MTATLAPYPVVKPSGDQVETEFQRRRRLMFEVLEAVHARGCGLRMADNLPREALYDRDALR